MVAWCGFTIPIPLVSCDLCSPWARRTRRGCDKVDVRVGVLQGDEGTQRSETFVFSKDAGHVFTLSAHFHYKKFPHPEGCALACEPACNMCVLQRGQSPSPPPPLCLENGLKWQQHKSVHATIHTHTTNSKNPKSFELIVFRMRLSLQCEFTQTPSQNTNALHMSLIMY